MASLLKKFEKLARKAPFLSVFSVTENVTEELTHPFDERNIHPCLPSVVVRLFDDGYYAQATFEAFKYVDKEVSRLSGENESGSKLMGRVFSDDRPIIRLTPCMTTSEKDEQKGYMHLFTGSVMGIRNPRGHEHSVSDSPDQCLDHLALASVLLRRLEEAGLVLKKP
jgi:uncharacterized protein (TIGR02391 family)